MESWSLFWGAVLAVGCVAYFLLVLVIIPGGCRDVKDLLAELQRPDHRE